jgi:hypothetical protein
MSALGHKRTFVGAIEMSAPLKRLTTGLGENLLSLLVASETFTWLTQMFLPRIDRLERLAHWEDLETRIARLERLATVAGIAIAIGVGAAVGAYVQGAVQFQPLGWPAILASLAAIGLTILLQLKLIRLDA